MVMKTLCLAFFCLLLTNAVNAQSDTSGQRKNDLSVSGFLDIFYSYDFNQPKGDFRQPFLYNHNRHNEFNLNLGLVKVSIDRSGYRANIALQTGTYANDNYAAEPGLLKNIFEANAGVSLNNKKTIWLDAGTFASHIGFESAISIDNWTLTRSLLAENSPYYLSGIKTTFHPDDTWAVAIVLCNGWQRIQRLRGNSMPSLGTQLNLGLGENTTFNWSTFAGTDTPDSVRCWRYFNNLYAETKLSEKFGIIAGFDIGVQQKTKNSSDYNVWYSPVIIGRYSISEKFFATVRGEYYQDESGVIIDTGSMHGFRTTGLSLNLDFFPFPNLAYRIEGRWFNSKDKIFLRSQHVLINGNLFITTAVVLKFNEN